VKVWDVLAIAGVIIGIIGCFLPWGINFPTTRHPEQYVVAGTSLASGIFALIGLISAVMFLLIFTSKRKAYMVFAVLTSGLVTLIISGNFIQYPSYHIGNRFIPIPIRPPGGILPPTALYGAYVTLIGALTVSGLAFLYIAATAEKQRRLSRSNQRT